jgi:hypothetical protein
LFEIADLISTLSEHAELISKLLVNLVGVFVGVYLALRMDRRERKKIENEERRRISNGLISELKFNLKRLRSGDKITLYEIGGVKRESLLTRFNTAVLKSVINSGKMILLDADIQSTLSNIDQILSLCEMTTNRVMSFVTSIDRVLKKNERKQVLNWLVENLEAQYKALEDIIPDTIKKLEKEKK